MKKLLIISLNLVLTTNIAAQSFIEVVSANSLISKTKKPVRDRGLQLSLEAGYNNALSSNSIDESRSSDNIKKCFSATGSNIALTYKFNKFFSLGIGAGFHDFETGTPTGIYNEEGVRRYYSGSKSSWDGTMEQYSIQNNIYGSTLKGSTIDVFLRTTFRLNDKKVAPLISIDAGYRLYDDFNGSVSYVNYDMKDVYDLKSFYVSPSVGLSLRVTNNSYIELKAGYDFTSPIKEQSSSGEWGSMDIKYYHTSQYGKHVWFRKYDEINLSSFNIRLGFTHTMNFMPRKKNPKYQYNYSYFDSGDIHVDGDKIKEIFDEAYGTPETDAQSKYNKYIEVIKSDPYNQTGYLALAYNNIGAIFENQGNANKAISYYQIATTISPTFDLAQSNLKRMKSDRNSRRWDSIINGLTIVGESLQSLSEGLNSGETGFTNDFNPNAGPDNSSSNRRNSSSSSSSSNSKKVDLNAIRNLERAYDGYETQLVKMKSSGDYSKDEVRSIQRKMREAREKYNKLSGRSRAVSPYETWNP